MVPGSREGRSIRLGRLRRLRCQAARGAEERRATLLRGDALIPRVENRAPLPPGRSVSYYPPGGMSTPPASPWRRPRWTSSAGTPRSARRSPRA
jgi:hypothetical protein